MEKIVSEVNGMFQDMKSSVLSQAVLYTCNAKENAFHSIARNICLTQCVHIIMRYAGTDEYIP